MNIFEQASRAKLRFEVAGGTISVEDLWDLPLKSTKVSLNGVAKTLSRQIREDSEEDFVAKKSSVNRVLQLKFDLVKHVIDVRLTEIENADVAKKKADEKAFLQDLLAKKQRNAMEELSEEDIKAKIASLG